ncbi:MFS transporter [Mycoplasmopsis sturni]|uniref:MFS transporter n=1 Tax=Mycoplasmopsis sturni TaxID=39047 RepID=UPI000560A322|nr:MFS transporter [Mycoplasmopsis sturni]
MPFQLSLNTYTKNLSKYISSVGISAIGSEAFKLASSLYIYKITGDFWLVTIFYLLIQIPSLIVYAFSSKLIKLLPDRKALLICDITSSIILVIPLILSFWFLNLNSNGFSYFSIVLIIVQSLLGFIHSYRLIHLKNIIYYVANSDNELHKMNTGFSLGLGISFVLSPLLSYFLYTNLPFYFLVILNIGTYLLSGFLYWSILVSKSPHEFAKDENKSDLINVYKTKHYKWWSWTLILSCSFIIGIILFPKNTGLIQYFKSIEGYSYQQWSFYFSLIMSLCGLIGTILVYFLNHKKNKIKKLNIAILLLIIALINITWIPFGLKASSTVNLIYYTTINAFQQFFYSFFLPSFYSISYKLFDRNKFHFQNGMSLVFRIISSSLITLFLTYLNNFFSYFEAYLTYSILIIVFAFLVALSYYVLTTYKAKNYYNSEKVKNLYIEYRHNNLWHSEQKVIQKYLKNHYAKLRILDLGCGTGRTTFALKELYPNAKIDAIDISKELLTQCRQINTFNDIVFKLQDISKKQFWIKSQYDFIFFSFNGITNILKEKQIRTTFSNISKSLKDNGYFIFTTHNLYSNEQYREFWDNFIKINELETFSDKKILTKVEYGTLVKNRFYTIKDIENIAKNYSFEIVEIFNRDEALETEMVKSISTPVTFYVLKKLNKKA